MSGYSVSVLDQEAFVITEKICNDYSSALTHMADFLTQYTRAEEAKQPVSDIKRGAWIVILKHFNEFNYKDNRLICNSHSEIKARLFLGNGN